MSQKITLKAYWECINPILLSTFKDQKMLISLCSSLLFLGVEVGSNIGVPLLLKETIDRFSRPLGMGESLYLIILGYGALWITSQVVVHLRSLLTCYVEQRLTYVLELKMLSHLYTLSHSYFLNQKPGELTNIIRRAQRDMPTLTLGFFFHVIPTIIEFLCVIIFIALRYPPLYSLLMSCTLMAFFVYTSLSMKAALENRENANKMDQKADGVVTDWLSNYEAVRIFGKQDFALKTCEEQLKKRENSEVSFMTQWSLSRLGQSLILGIGLTSLTYLVSRGVQNGELTVGDFVLFNGYILQFITPISILGQVTQDIKKAIINMKEIVNILLTKSHIQEAPNPKQLPKQSSQIEFKSVSFTYGERKILEDLSFTIHPEETVLIMGPTGQGKSTIAKLLLRLYDPTAGQILINQTDLKQISFDSLAETMAWVPQESYLLNDTIQNNLLFVRPNAHQQEVEEAIDRACLHDFIKKLPRGLHTLVGNRGLKLSGGEKQRLSLARLFLKKPKIGIFDEATSFLDRGTELTIQDNIRRFLPKMTKIIITHRPFMLEKADKIITLDKRGTTQKNIFDNNLFQRKKNFN